MSNFFDLFFKNPNLPKNNEEHKKLCYNIVHEILNDEDYEYNVQDFVEKLRNIENNKKDIFIKKFNDIILNNNILKEIDIHINDLYMSLFAGLLPTDTNDQNMFLLTIKNSTKVGFFDVSNTEEYSKIDITCFEFNMQLFLCELNKLPNTKKEKILNIFYDIMGNELPNRPEKNNSSKKTNNTEIKEEIKTDYSKNIVKENFINYIPKCKDKLKEIKELSQDFEYAVKNDYHKECDDIESKLNNGIDNKNELNKIIDDINNLYRNAYNKKHNKSSLAYIMDVEEDIDLLEHI